MDKKLSLKIGEKEVSLNFGVNWFFEFYKNDSGHDLVKDPNLELLDLRSIEVFSYLKNMIWAGYQAECKMQKVPTELSREDVENYIMGGTEQQAADLVWVFMACSYGLTVEKLKELAMEKSEEKKSS
jgi:hypothetical protein